MSVLAAAALFMVGFTGGFMLAVALIFLPSLLDWLFQNPR